MVWTGILLGAFWPGFTMDLSEQGDFALHIIIPPWGLGIHWRIYFRWTLVLDGQSFGFFNFNRSKLVYCLFVAEHVLEDARIMFPNASM